MHTGHSEAADESRDEKRRREPITAAVYLMERGNHHVEQAILAKVAADELADEAIVARVRDGETALYEVLVRRYNQRLYRTIRAILRDDRNVEDVMQQVYIDAYLHLDQFRGDAKFATWLTRIAVNRAIRTGRGEMHGLALAAEDGEAIVERVPAGNIDPEHAMYGHELKVVLESLIEQLPEPFRLVFVLREVEGLSTAETAACLAIYEDTVKTRLHRAKRLLQDQIDRRLGPAASQVYAFHLSRCDRVVAGVMAALHAKGPAN
jgi:RNA polymerase sigma-70 factor (ECF subfamily)